MKTKFVFFFCESWDNRIQAKDTITNIDNQRENSRYFISKHSWREPGMPG